MKRDILYELKSLQKEIMRKSFNWDFPKENMPTSHVQIKIFDYLIENIGSEVNQKDLEEKVNIRKSTLSGVLDTMEKNKLIIRTSTKNDARKKIICLSKEAQEKHQEIKKRIQKTSLKITKGIPSAKLNIFYEVIDTMRNNIN